MEASTYIVGQPIGGGFLDEIAGMYGLVRRWPDEGIEVDANFRERVWNRMSDPSSAQIFNVIQELHDKLLSQWADGSWCELVNTLLATTPRGTSP